jgi:hypothetical protein
MVRTDWIVIDKDFVAVSGVGVSLSVAVTVKLNVPAAVGVPLMVPSVPSGAKPVGKAPLVNVH